MVGVPATAPILKTLEEGTPCALVLKTKFPTGFSKLLFWISTAFPRIEICQFASIVWLELMEPLALIVPLTLRVELGTQVPIPTLPLVTTNAPCGDVVPIPTLPPVNNAELAALE